MNICFIQGKVIEEVRFKFYIESKKLSIAKTKVKLSNGNIVVIKGYNEMADWIFHYIEKEDRIYIQGKLDTNMEIEVEWILRK